MNCKELKLDLCPCCTMNMKCCWILEYYSTINKLDKVELKQYFIDQIVMSKSWEFYFMIVVNNYFPEKVFDPEKLKILL